MIYLMTLCIDLIHHHAFGQVLAGMDGDMATSERDIKRGELFGVMALTTNQPYFHTVVATGTDCIVGHVVGHHPSRHYMTNVHPKYRCDDSLPPSLTNFFVFSLMNIVSAQSPAWCCG
jgi:hypothetical protein